VNSAILWSCQPFCYTELSHFWYSAQISIFLQYSVIFVILSAIWLQWTQPFATVLCHFITLSAILRSCHHFSITLPVILRSCHHFSIMLIHFAKSSVIVKILSAILQNPERAGGRRLRQGRGSIVRAQGHTCTGAARSLRREGLGGSVSWLDRGVHHPRWWIATPSLCFRNNSGFDSNRMS
jgi:hypothetical protein